MPISSLSLVYGAARNMVTGAEVPPSIINGLLSLREKGEE